MRNKQRAFTLLEVLIALLIFSIIALVMTLVLQSVFTARERTTEQAKQLAKLQVAIVLMQRDFEQTINRPVRQANGTLQAALAGNNTKVTFTRAGFSNPQAALQRSQLQRVAYYSHNHQLFRRSWDRLDPARLQQFTDKLLLNHVESLTFHYLNKRNSSVVYWPLSQKALVNKKTGAPIEQLPRAVRVTMRLSNMGDISLLFPIPGGDN